MRKTANSQRVYVCPRCGRHITFDIPECPNCHLVFYQDHTLRNILVCLFLLILIPLLLFSGWYFLTESETAAAKPVTVQTKKEETKESPQTNEKHTLNTRLKKSLKCSEFLQLFSSDKQELPSELYGTILTVSDCYLADGEAGLFIYDASGNKSEFALTVLDEKITAQIQEHTADEPVILEILSEGSPESYGFEMIVQQISY